MQIANDTSLIKVPAEAEVSIPKQTAAPTAQKDRIAILDSLRGFAILGILLMNMAAFSSPYYLDISVRNETGWNYISWFLMVWLFDGTQRALFSMLFGAGIVLFLTNQHKKLTGTKPLEFFLRRQAWLLFFGLVNIYVLLWHGDILFDYAAYGFLMVLFWQWSPKNLVIAAIVSMLVMIGVENKDLYHSKQVIARGQTVEALDTTVTKLSVLQKADLEAMNEFKKSNEFAARKQRGEATIARMTNDYRWVYETRTESYRRNFFNYSYFGIWDVLQFMFLGMAFFKNGVLTGKSSSRFYLLMAIGGLAIGLGLSYLRIKEIEASSFNFFNYTKQAVFSFYSLDRIFRALGIFGVIMLLFKSGAFKWLFGLMRAPGQMAFTNYLMQSVIALVLFYGIGFALYGQLERYQTYLIVFGIWGFQIAFSHACLRYFQFGPLEWAWRSLTYWKLQPLKK